MWQEQVFLSENCWHALIVETPKGTPRFTSLQRKCGKDKTHRFKRYETRLDPYAILNEIKKKGGRSQGHFTLTEENTHAITASIPVRRGPDRIRLRGQGGSDRPGRTHRPGRTARTAGSCPSGGIYRFSAHGRCLWLRRDSLHIRQENRSPVLRRPLPERHR